MNNNDNNSVAGKISYAYLETTNYCNLGCSFCNRLDVIGPLTHMSLDNWEMLLNKIKHHPIKEAKLMGMGEPFLHPNFDIVNKMFKETFPECFVVVATNCQYNIGQGTELRRKFEESLKYIDMLYLSIDGWGESYERDRPPAKWSKLIKFLKDLQTVNKNDCDIVINYVVNSDNVFDIPKVDGLREKYNLGKLRLNIAQSWDQGSFISSDQRTWGYTKKQIEYLKDNYQNIIMGKSQWDFNNCFWPDNGLYVSVNGEVKVCCMNTGAKSFGNIFDDSIENIRNGIDFQEVKSGCQKNEPSDHCKKCSYKELVPLLKELGVNNP